MKAISGFFWFGIWCIVFLLFVGAAASALDLSRIPLAVSAGTHSMTVPWHMGPVTDRLNPAFLIGTERTLRSGDRLRWYHTANVGFFRHYWWMTGVSLDAEFGASYRIWRGLHADLRLGAGYLHYFWRRKVLELKNGEYVQVTDWGKPSVLFPLSLVIGYRRGAENSFAVSPFVAGRWAVQTPFIEESPAMTHFMLLVGARIDWGRPAERDER